MKDIKPNYYRRTIKGVEIDVNDIADAFDLGYQAQNAIKYLVRAGRKDETKLVDDLVKARHYIDRLIKKHEEAEAKANEIADQKEFTFEGVQQAVTNYIEDLGDKKAETNPETIEDVGPVTVNHNPFCACAGCSKRYQEHGKTRIEEGSQVLSFWIVTKRDLWPKNEGPYHVDGPYTTKEQALRQLDPVARNQRVIHQTRDAVESTEYRTRTFDALFA